MNSKKSEKKLPPCKSKPKVLQVYHRSAKSGFDSRDKTPQFTGNELNFNSMQCFAFAYKEVIKPVMHLPILRPLIHSTHSARSFVFKSPGHDQFLATFRATQFGQRRCKELSK